MPGRSSRAALPLVILFLFAVFFLPQLLSLYVDWLWFKSVGFDNIFTTKLNAQAASGEA